MHWFNITCFSRSWQDRVPPEPRQPGDLPEGFWPNRALLRGGRRGQQSSPSGGPGQPAVPFPPAGGPNGGLPAISQHPSPLKYTTYPLHTSPSHGGPLDAGVIPLCPLPWSATTPPHHLYHHDKHKHTHLWRKAKMDPLPAPFFILLNQWTDFLQGRLMCYLAEGRAPHKLHYT